MSSDADEELERLREAFLDRAREAAPGIQAPSAEQIWKAAEGRLPADELRRVLDGLFEDPSSAEVWSIARSLLSEGERESSDRTSDAGMGRILWRVAAGFAIVVAVTAAWLTLRPSGKPVYRGGESAIESRLPENAVLPRQEAILRWEPVAGSRRYDLRLFDADYRVLRVVDGLTSPSFRIPPEVLKDIAGGQSILWQVEAVFPDGASVLSETFRVTIADSGKDGAPEGK